MTSRAREFKFWPSLAFHAVLFAIIMGTYYAVDEGEVTAKIVLQAVVSGLLFGVFMALFHRWWGQRRSA